MVKKTRTKIPKEIAAKIMFQMDRTCCVCREGGKDVQTHHVNDDPSNHDMDNLAVLCFDCHNKTQLLGGFGRKLDSEQVKLYRNEWIQTVSEYRSKFREEIIKTKLAIRGKNDIKPVKTSDLDFPELHQQIRDLIKRIGKHKISELLQEAKLIASDTDDKEMSAWIEKELNGYSDKQETIKHDVATKIFPEYRYINTKFLLQASNNHAITQEVNYPIWMAHSITFIEGYLTKYRNGNVMITIQITLPKKIPALSSQTVDAILPEMELERIIHGIERKLSQYLESKLIL